MHIHVPTTTISQEHSHFNLSHDSELMLLHSVSSKLLLNEFNYLLVLLAYLIIVFACTHLICGFDVVSAGFLEISRESALLDHVQGTLNRSPPISEMGLARSLGHNVCVMQSHRRSSLLNCINSLSTRLPRDAGKYFSPLFQSSYLVNKKIVVQGTKCVLRLGA